MLLKKTGCLMCAIAVTVSAFLSMIFSVSADDALPEIKCTQSASITDNGDNFSLNTAGKETPDNIYWNVTSGKYKGVGVLEFELPAADPNMIKSTELTYDIHNGSSRSGGRTYDVYAADIVINETTTADTLQAIPFTPLLYTGVAVNKGETRTDTVPSESIKDYVKSKLSADNVSKIQFAFSNSSQILDISPTTASLKIVMYGGGIALDKHELSIYTENEPVQLDVNVFEQGIDKDSLVWESSDNSVVSVENGAVTPNNAGTAVITVRTTDNSFTDECIVTVLQAVESISLDKETLSLIAGGENGELTVSFTPDNAVNREVIWASSDESVAAVSQNGIVSPVGVGETVITVSSVSDNSIKAECGVIVSASVEPESISLSDTSISLSKLGSTVSLETNILPENADSRVTWTSSDTNVAQIYDGIIVSGESGTAVITAATSNGKTAQCTVTVTDDKQLITNDYFYKDTDGNPIYSQGGGISKFGDTYYWYGVRYTEAVDYVKDPLNASKLGDSLTHFEAYTCYSSKDLVNWKYEGDAATSETLGIEWIGWAGRCGVVYHEATDKYILCSQCNGVVIASSDKPTGPFKAVNHYDWNTAIPGIQNGSTGDQTMFQDEDSKAYMICSSVNGRSYQYVVPLRESDFCDFDTDNIKMLYKDNKTYFDEDGTVATKDKGGIEGNCMFKYKGNYYYTGSDLYGWNSSRVYVLQSDSILGDYNIQPDGSKENKPYIMPGVKTNYAHNTQAGFYYTVKGTKQDLVIYCGDRWSDFAVNGIGFNQWNPLTMDGYTPHFNNLSQWRLNAETGEWSVGDGNNYLANPFFEADRVELNKLTGWECSDNIGGAATGNIKSKRTNGTYSARHSADTDYTATMKQTVKELPDGVYTLRASVKSSGGQNECKLYAKTDENEYSASLKSEMSDWTDIVIKNIEVRNGECEVGLYSDANAGNYVRIDDMYFTRNYDGTVIEGKPNTNVPGAKNSLKLSDADGNVVISLAGGAEVHAEAEYTNTASLNIDISLYIALYNKDGTLCEIKSKNINSVQPGQSGKAETESIILPAESDGLYAKLFLWDGDMKPLCDYILIE